MKSNLKCICNLYLDYQSQGEKILAVTGFLLCNPNIICEMQRPYHLNMRIDASDKDRASSLKQTNDYLGQQCKQVPNS